MAEKRIVLLQEDAAGKFAERDLAPGNEGDVIQLDANGLPVVQALAGYLRKVTAPANDNAAGTAGDFACDGDYAYYCITTGADTAAQWVRWAVSQGW